MTQPSSLGISNTIAVAVRRVVTGNHAAAALIGIGLVVFAGVIAPGENPDWWTWTRMLVAAGCAGPAIAVIDASRTADAVGNRSGALIVAGLLLLITVLVSASFTSLTVLMALIVIALMLLHLQARGPSSLPVLWALLTVLIPFWVWSAFDAWDRQLLWLIPLGVVGIVALEHALRVDLHGESTAQRERLATWIGVLAVAALLVLTCLLADSIERGWVAGGAIVALLFAAADLAPQRRAAADAIPSLTLPAGALLALMLTWLIAL